MWRCACATPAPAWTQTRCSACLNPFSPPNRWARARAWGWRWCMASCAPTKAALTCAARQARAASSPCTFRPWRKRRCSSCSSPPRLCQHQKNSQHNPHSNHQPRRRGRHQTRKKTAGLGLGQRTPRHQHQYQHQYRKRQRPQHRPRSLQPLLHPLSLQCLRRTQRRLLPPPARRQWADCLPPQQRLQRYPRRYRHRHSHQQRQRQWPQPRPLAHRATM